MTQNISNQALPLAGIFSEETRAQSSMEPLLEVPGITTGQVRLLGPKDAYKRTRELFGRGIEPFERGAQNAMLRAHLMSNGAVGAVMGTILYFWLQREQWPQLISHPIVAFLAIFGASTLLGLAFASAMTLRAPRQSMRAKMLSSVRAALMHNNWAIIVRPSNRKQSDLARQILNRYADEIHTA